MSAGESKVVNPSRRLPELSLPLYSTGEPTPIRLRRRRSPLLILVHGSVCLLCAEFVARLEAEVEAIQDWDGYPLVITTGTRDAHEVAASAAVFPVVMDAEGRLAGALGIRAPAVIIADQWGEVHETREAGDGHDFPRAREVVTYLRYLSIQCPECQGESF